MKFGMLVDENKLQNGIDTLPVFTQECTFYICSVASIVREGKKRRGK